MTSNSVAPALASRVAPAFRSPCALPLIPSLMHWLEKQLPEVSGFNREPWPLKQTLLMTGMTLAGKPAGRFGHLVNDWCACSISRMMSTTQIVRTHLTEGAAPDGELAGLEAKLVAAVVNDTLNILVLSALDFREHGRIDQSIQLITRANKMQLDAIEALQGIIDTLKGRAKKQVVFSKYRQFPPFEMGIEDADDVLRLIASMKDVGAANGGAQCARLHELEALRNAEAERLEFFEQRFDDGSEDETIDEARTILRKLNADLLGAKHEVLNVALATTQSFLVLMGEEANISTASYELPRCLYILATSPIRTRHADDVQTEKGA